MGAPGSGKGTQAGVLAEEFKLCHLSTGDMLRDAVSKGTEFGRLAKRQMETGGLVSDDIVTSIIDNNLGSERCRRGFILDGFPRTIPQAESLDDMLMKRGEKIDAAIQFDVDDEEVVKRVTGRWIHKASGRSYHTVFNPPKSAGVDDLTGEPLIQRPDDTEEICRTRLKNYHTQASALLRFYHQKKVLKRINAMQPITTVRSNLKRIFNNQQL